MTIKKQAFTVPFSHLDLFWAGTREECLSRGSRVISTALDLLEAEPDYRFMIEAVNFMENHLDCFPEDRERMKRLIRKGQLEVIPMRAILYSHLPSGETTVRNLLYGKEFCRKELDAIPTVMSLSDIPGVTAQLPQIAALAGMNGIVLSRGFREHTDHVLWRAPDGTAVRAYCPKHYGDLCTLLSRKSVEEMREKLPEFLPYFDAVDHPQIFHWGMDLYVLNANILKRIRELSRTDAVEFVFSTFREFFDRTREVVTQELAGEIPSTWPNIESSWPDLWPLDIPAENAMREAEFFASLNRLTGYRNDSATERKQAWLHLLDSMDHNQNGIGGDLADADKRNLKLLAEMTARNIAERDCRRIAARTTAPSETAAPIVVFNPLSWKRSGIVRARAACYGSSFATQFDEGFLSTQHYERHPYRPFRLIDETGCEIPYKKENHLMMLADTLELSFYAEDVPAFGCKTYYVELREEGRSFDSPFTIRSDRAEDRRNAGRNLGSETVENAFFRLEISRATGELSLFDKQNDRLLFERAGIIGIEETRGEYIYNMQLSGRVFPALIDQVEITEENAVYCRAEIRGSICGQPFHQRLTLSANAPELEMENTIRWNEIRYVRLEQCFPFASAENGEICYGTPFGMIRYPETMYGTNGESAADENAPTRNIRLVRDWVDIGDARSGVTVAADHRMWTFDGNTMRNCMIRGIGWTSGGVRIEEDGSQTGIQRPPCGEYSFRYRITPHKAEAFPEFRTGWELNAPFRTAAVACAAYSDEPGLRLPAMPDSARSTVIVSGVKPAENGKDIVFRCFEAMGEVAELELPEAGNGIWQEADLMEENTHPITGNRVSFRPFEIKTLIRTL